MPSVQITWVAGRSAEQKRKIAERVTQALVEDGKAKLENIHVTFHDLLKIAFKGKMIEDLDHPVLRRLRGEI